MATRFATRFRRLASAGALALGLFSFVGCAYIPWHPFGTPLTAEKKAEQKQVVAQDKVSDALQEEVHKTSAGIELAIGGNPLALGVAQAHGRTALSLVDQVRGAPTVEEDAKWRDLVARQAASDEKVRVIAEKENASRLTEISRLSVELDNRNTQLDAANKKVSEYAAEKAAIANKFLWLCWIAGALVAWHFLGQILAFAARLDPAFAGVAHAVNMVTSPVHAIVARATAAATALKTP